MRQNSVIRGLAAATVVVALGLAGCVALADPPPGKGKGRGHGGEPARVSVEFAFTDGDRVVIRDWYGGMHERGSCPPGLAKKQNGCMPPGQAKKWAMGRPLPRDVVFYDLPGGLTARLSVPPPGYRYVRVAADILLIAAGTGMVVSAIEDLARQ